MKRIYADVLVVGGGVAGVAAAIAAAREGANTLLVEKHTCLGGIATSGLVNGIAGVIEGLCKEFLDRMEAEAKSTKLTRGKKMRGQETIKREVATLNTRSIRLRLGPEPRAMRLRV